jgi:hypothetical protein
MSSFSFNLPYIAKEIRRRTGVTRNPTIIFYLSLAESPSRNINSRMIIEPPNTSQTEYINSTVFNQIYIGPTNTLQTSISPLYSDFDLQYFIGTNSSNVTIYNDPIPNPRGLYDTTVTTVYRLSNGSIGISHAPELQKFDTFYGLPKDRIEIAPIVYGTGHYLNRTGYVAIVTGETTTKLILVYIV